VSSISVLQFCVFWYQSRCKGANWSCGFVCCVRSLLTRSGHEIPHLISTGSHMFAPVYICYVLCEFWRVVPAYVLEQSWGGFLLRLAIILVICLPAETTLEHAWQPVCAPILLPKLYLLCGFWYSPASWYKFCDLELVYFAFLVICRVQELVRPFFLITLCYRDLRSDRNSKFTVCWVCMFSFQEEYCCLPVWSRVGCCDLSSLVKIFCVPKNVECCV
jgi:hypothetical protein